MASAVSSRPSGVRSAGLPTGPSLRNRPPLPSRGDLPMYLPYALSKVAGECQLRLESHASFFLRYTVPTTGPG